MSAIARRSGRRWRAASASVAIVLPLHMSGTLHAQERAGAPRIPQTLVEVAKNTRGRLSNPNSETDAKSKNSRTTRAVEKPSFRSRAKTKTTRQVPDAANSARSEPPRQAVEVPAMGQTAEVATDQAERAERPTHDELSAIAKAFCSNNAASAAEARHAAQRKELEDLSREVEKRSVELVEMSKEARVWVEKREKLMATTRDGLVEAYAKMKPEAAAQQIGSMSEEAAVSILMNLNARASSAILNEMVADRAARLADAAMKRPGAKVRDKNGS